MKLVLSFYPGALVDKAVRGLLFEGIAETLARRLMGGPEGSRRMGMAQWEGLWGQGASGRRVIRPRDCRYGLGTDR